MPPRPFPLIFLKALPLLNQVLLHHLLISFLLVLCAQVREQILDLVGQSLVLVAVLGHFGGYD